MKLYIAIIAIICTIFANARKLRDDTVKNKKLAVGAKESCDTSVCGSCYGAETGCSSCSTCENIKCCNTCDEVKEAYENLGWAVHEGSFLQCAPVTTTSAPTTEAVESKNDNKEEGDNFLYKFGDWLNDILTRFFRNW